MFCGNCGKQISVENKFCAFCGSKINAEESLPHNNEPIASLSPPTKNKPLNDYAANPIFDSMNNATDYTGKNMKANTFSNNPIRRKSILPYFMLTIPCFIQMISIFISNQIMSHTLYLLNSVDVPIMGTLSTQLLRQYIITVIGAVSPFLLSPLALFICCFSCKEKSKRGLFVVSFIIATIVSTIIETFIGGIISSIFHFNWISILRTIIYTISSLIISEVLFFLFELLIDSKKNNIVKEKNTENLHNIENYSEEKSSCSKLVAALLCFFLGEFGVHRFYAGKIGTGILWLFTFGFCGIAVFIDFIVILCGGFTDSEGRKI